MIKTVVRCVGFLMLFWVGQGVAQTNADCPPALMQLEQQKAYVEKAPAKNAGFLWRMEKDGRTSWLYGTMHMMHIDYAKPGMQIMMGMRNSDVLAVEINTYETQPSVKISHTSFKLSPNHLERMQAAYTKDCLSGDPAQLFLSPLLQSQAQRQHLHWGFGPDARLMQIAKRTNKPIIALETMEIQVKALSPQSQAEFDAQLDASLESIETGQFKNALTTQAKAWQTNDFAVFIKNEEEMVSQEPAFMTRLNDERNVAMAQKIEALHNEGKRVFVAVGVTHMTGKQALPKLMAEKGYTLQFVPLKN